MRPRASSGDGGGDEGFLASSCSCSRCCGGHLDLGAADKVENAGHAAFHLVHGGAIRVHVPRLGRFTVLGKVMVVVVTIGPAIAIAGGITRMTITSTKASAVWEVNFIVPVAGLRVGAMRGGV